MKISSKWQHFRFSEDDNHIRWTTRHEFQCAQDNNKLLSICSSVHQENNMGLKLAAFIFALIATGIAYIFLVPPTLEPVNMEPGWWGPGEKKEDDVTIKPMTIKIPDADIKDLMRRLEATRFGSDLEDGNFEYGFQTEYMKTVRQYWLTNFDWRKQEAVLNQLKHFTTQIEGIDVHFMRILPKKKGNAMNKFIVCAIKYRFINRYDKQGSLAEGVACTRRCSH